MFKEQIKSLPSETFERKKKKKKIGKGLFLLHVLLKKKKYVFYDSDFASQ